VKQTDTIGIAPIVQLTHINASGGFYIIPFDAPSLRTNYGIMHLRDRSLSPSAMVFIEQSVALEKAYFGSKSGNHLKWEKKRDR